MSEKDPNVKTIKGDLRIHESETFPHPRPICPNCHGNMRWFWMEGIQMRGWFCTCPDMRPREVEECLEER